MLFTIFINISYFASTSGSTGKMKLIPVTDEGIKTNIKVTKATAYVIYNNCPEAFDGKILQLVGAEVEGETVVGIPYGSATGSMAKKNQKV